MWSIVAITTLVGIALVGRTSSAPDMFTALVDMQRALSDEQSAALLLRQHISFERQRLQLLERYVLHTFVIITDKCGTVMHTVAYVCASVSLLFVPEPL